MTKHSIHSEWIEKTMNLISYYYFWPQNINDPSGIQNNKRVSEKDFWKYQSLSPMRSTEVPQKATVNKKVLEKML